MSGWKDIATAPKDAGALLLRGATGSVYIGHWNGKTWDDGDFFDDLGTMTHWYDFGDGKPMPDAPEVG